MQLSEEMFFFSFLLVCNKILQYFFLMVPKVSLKVSMSVAPSPPEPSSLIGRCVLCFLTVYFLCEYIFGVFVYPRFVLGEH